MSKPKKRVLLCDDDELLLEIIAALLTDAGFEALTTHDPEQVLPLCRAERPDLVLLDIHLPREPLGLKVLERLRADPATKAVPVAMISSDQHNESRAAAQKLGTVAFLPKPVNSAAFVQEVRRLLDAGRG